MHIWFVIASVRICMVLYMLLPTHTHTHAHAHNLHITNSTFKSHSCYTCHIHVTLHMHIHFTHAFHIPYYTIEPPTPENVDSCLLCQSHVACVCVMSPMYASTCLRIQFPEAPVTCIHACVCVYMCI